MNNQLYFLLRVLYHDITLRPKKTETMQSLK
jgi:hypothetical protein